MSQATNRYRDLVCIDNLHISANIGPDRWKKSRPQPLVLSISFQADLSTAGAQDDLTGSVNYGTLAKTIRNEIHSDESRIFPGLEALAEEVSRVALSFAPESAEVTVSITAPKFLLHDAVSKLDIIRCAPPLAQRKGLKWCINHWKFYIIIGMNPEERKERQLLFSDLQCFFENETSSDMKIDIPSIINRVAEASGLFLRIPS